MYMCVCMYVRKVWVKIIWSIHCDHEGLIYLGKESLFIVSRVREHTDRLCAQNAGLSYALVAEAGIEIYF
jgi:hypothetical protein